MTRGDTKHGSVIYHIRWRKVVLYTSIYSRHVGSYSGDSRRVSKVAFGKEDGHGNQVLDYTALVDRWKESQVHWDRDSNASFTSSSNGMRPAKYAN